MGKHRQPVLAVARLLLVILTLSERSLPKGKNPSISSLPFAVACSLTVYTISELL
jgi:hypothetical protein